MRNRLSKNIALGGMLSALAVVIMCFGAMVPLATFVCPVIAIFTGQVTVRTCGRRIGWCWYAVVVLLSVLMSPDKEAAATFAFLGYYPMVKPVFDRWKLGWLGKFALFNMSVIVMYALLLRLFGMENLTNEFRQLGKLGMVVLLLLGNATFFLLDRLLTIIGKRK